ncbi:MAG: hypothetical protein UX78_C0005G0027 [Candidatus Amesbacteria bacterium GW2011_GWA2_47_11]|uniref:Uncharacterized protein n=2 Tax=Candidatus Amesiibacteriota TaxID=1752730 RepID=A0A0G1XKR5_9BACT|nr:MAG: hypothetical protein UX78_C0005G0027 [Candidatus Amesbacteria bacterium GW2011_GWA2_47_11]KKU94935.1 MAG: hypothetical protein UY22_C0004G0030 [Candidatus Amesbacteria bacterium GW2011_GWC1_48_10]
MRVKCFIRGLVDKEASVVGDNGDFTFCDSQKDERQES